MVRTARKKSETGIYHVMLRGIDKRELFLNEADYRKFLDYIVRAKKKVGFLDLETRNKILKNIKEKTGASNRQLSRVLNIGRGVLEKIK